MPTGLGLGSVLFFSLDGSDFTGTITAQFGQPYPTVLATLAGGGNVEGAYSAVFHAVPVPEPSAALLLAAGIVPLWRRRSAR